jgi:hypothetical protein
MSRVCFAFILQVHARAPSVYTDLFIYNLHMEGHMLKASRQVQRPASWHCGNHGSLADRTRAATHSLHCDWTTIVRLAGHYKTSNVHHMTEQLNDLNNFCSTCLMAYELSELHQLRVWLLTLATLSNSNESVRHKQTAVGATHTRSMLPTLDVTTG